MSSDTTHFGYKTVNKHEKERHVAQVFDSVAEQYDLMNDLMSFGIHRYWKHYCIQQSRVRPGDHVLDLAGGTGDLASAFASRVGETGHVVLADINAAMLDVGRSRLLDEGHVTRVSYAQANAQYLPFADNQFDCITIAFGLRNVTDKDMALRSMQRVLKPGGRMLILEFSKPVVPLLEQMYDLYSFSVLPQLGRWVTGDADSYQYLAESIRMHPNQERLKSMVLAAGFDDCQYTQLTGGIVALHKAYKY